MGDNTAMAIIVTGFFLMIGFVCLATHSAAPLLLLLVLAFLFSL
jgi:hypothetical protein